MSAVFTPKTPKRKESIGERRFVLHDVSWETYEQLLKNYENRSAPRFTYSEGMLEIMSPLPSHEIDIDALRQIVYEILDARTLNGKCLGSTTFRRKEWNSGAEPDACFYIQSVDRIKGKDLNKLDITKYPPDLVIEVDYTSPSIDKFPIYATLGVTEIWLYKNDNVKFFRLNKKKYVEIPESIVLPKVSVSDVTRYVHENREMDRIEWLRNVKTWLNSL